jgi:predicted PurR-regulated permease PerM
VSAGERAPPPQRWILVFLIPAALISVWILGGVARDLFLIFGVAVVIALLLNPLVRLLHLPRPVAVVILVLALVAVLAGAVALIQGPARDQLSQIRTNIPTYTADAQDRAADLQSFLADHGIDVDLESRAANALPDLREWLSEQTGRVLAYGLDAVRVLLALIVIVVSSIYLLLDARRIARGAERMVPGAAGLLRASERRVGRYLRAQLLISAIIGVTVGVAMWALGVSGVFPAGSRYALAFGVWAFFMEFVPYVGPILEALPPLVIALFSEGFLPALWVAVAFIVIQQLEGHLVVPKIMGNAAGVHPLVVIFGLLVGEALFGFLGVLLALPLLVILREAVAFAWDRTTGGASAAPAAAAPESSAALTVGQREGQGGPGDS